MAAAGRAATAWTVWALMGLCVRCWGLAGRGCGRIGAANLGRMHLVDVTDAKHVSENTLDIVLEKGHPLLVSGLFDHVDGERWVSRFVGACARERIQYDSRHSRTGTVASYECELHEFLSAVVEGSDHEESLYFMSEDLLDHCSALVDSMRLPPAAFESNMFDLFPTKIRPKPAIVIGGAGARSFLHNDPFDWLGWNHLFEGRKLWIFCSGEVDPAQFGARIHAPDAWGLDRFPIAQGWVSDVDLFREAPLLHHVSRQTHVPELSFTIGHASPTVRRRYRRVPRFRMDRGAIAPPSHWHLVLQEENETVLIPPRAWHQVYHLQPSVALASQHMNTWNRDEVLGHIVDTCCSQEQVAAAAAVTLAQAPSQPRDADRILAAIRIALIGKFGSGKGSRMFERLIT